MKNALTPTPLHLLPLLHLYHLNLFADQNVNTSFWSALFKHLINMLNQFASLKLGQGPKS